MVTGGHDHGSVLRGRASDRRVHDVRRVHPRGDEVPGHVRVLCVCVYIYIYIHTHAHTHILFVETNIRT